MERNKILIDTDMLVCAWNRQDAAKQRKAIEIIDRHKNSIVLSVQNLSEFIAVMRKHTDDDLWLMSQYDLSDHSSFQQVYEPVLNFQY